MNRVPKRDLQELVSAITDLLAEAANPHGTHLEVLEITAYIRGELKAVPEPPLAPAPSGPNEPLPQLRESFSPVELGRPLALWGVPTSVVNTLVSVGIHTLQHLLLCSAEEVDAIEGMGPSRMAELTQALRIQAIQLVSSKDNWVQSPGSAWHTFRTISTLGSFRVPRSQISLAPSLWLADDSVEEDLLVILHREFGTQSIGQLAGLSEYHVSRYPWQMSEVIRPREGGYPDRVTPTALAIVSINNMLGRVGLGPISQ